MTGRPVRRPRPFVTTMAGATGAVHVSLTRPRPSPELERMHRRRVQAAEDAYALAKATGDVATIEAAMRDLDDARQAAHLWAR